MERGLPLMTGIPKKVCQSLKRLAACASLAACMLGCSGCNGCYSQTSDVLLGDYGSYLDEKMSSEDMLSRLDGASDGLCVTEDESVFSPDEIAASAGALYNITDLVTLYSKNASDELGIASITKLMTALITLEQADLNEEVTIEYSGEDLGGGAVLCRFEPGDKLSISSLLSSALIYSGNDAAIDLAIAVAGSEDAFVSMMNEKSDELMMTHSHFANATGLQKSGHYSSVYDIYLMFNECLKYQMFRSIIQRGTFLCYYTNAEGENVTKSFTSTNLYLTGQYTAPDGVTIIGGKTGHTASSGYSLAVLAEDSSRKEYIGIILGAESKDELYGQMNTLLAKITQQ